MADLHKINNVKGLMLVSLTLISLSAPFVLQTTTFAATYTVTSTSDSDVGSLRQAILDANSNAGTDTIDFNIATNCPKIVPNSPLPPINSVVASPVIIDATTQACTNGSADAPNVEISGNNAGAGAIGLRITGNGAGSTIRGLVINRFKAQGIFIDTNNVTVAGNYIGTDATGSIAAGNAGDGIAIFSGTVLATANSNTIGGIIPGDRNIISGNGGNGVGITAQVGGNASNNIISGNYIGTNASGTGAISNVGDGVLINHANGGGPASTTGNTIGGTTDTTPGGACTGACNLISGNSQNGIYISGVESFGHQIKGNYIGTNANGTGAIGNVLDGIGVLSTPNLAIGDGTNNGRNIIAANGQSGIIIVGGASTGNRIQGNSIGMSTSGATLGNTNRGVVISGATDIAILKNSISFNGGLGIDLDNNGTVNINDSGDSDGSSNRLQNYPVVYAAQTKGGTTKIGGQFNGTPNSRFRIEFFYSDGCNAGFPNNFGEGQTYLDTTEINTDVFGNTAFGITTSTTVPGNKYITATATKMIGNTPAETSEFSQCVLVNTSKPALTNGATWFLKNDLTTGPADKTFGYGFPSTLLMCAWDPNQPGVKLPVIYYNGQWFMRASYTTGTSDLSFSYGSGSHMAICGDWNGDGVDTPGVVTGTNQWLLRNSNSSGSPDAGNFQFGSWPSKPVVGDWDGNGTDTVGVVNSSSHWSLRNSNSAGAADAGDFSYGYIPGYKIVGDWDGNGTDTVGSVNPSGTWALRISNSSGAPNGVFQYGFPGTVPLTW